MLTLCTDVGQSGNAFETEEISELSGDIKIQQQNMNITIKILVFVVHWFLPTNVGQKCFTVQTNLPPTKKTHITSFGARQERAKSPFAPRHAPSQIPLLKVLNYTSEDIHHVRTTIYW